MITNKYTHLGRIGFSLPWIILSAAMSLTMACTQAPLNGDIISANQAAGIEAIQVTSFIPFSAGTITYSQSSGTSGSQSISTVFNANRLVATDVKGVAWYGFPGSSANLFLKPDHQYWSEMYNVPLGGQNYLTTTLHVAASNSSLGNNFGLYSFPGGPQKDANTTQCLQNTFINSGGLATIGTCGGSKADITLQLPCGGPGQACCIPTCVGGPTFPVLPCMNPGPDGHSLYACSGSPLSPNSVCLPTGGKCDLAGYPPCPPANCPGASPNPVHGCPYPNPKC